MKLYGIKIDKNENGEEVALIELTRKEADNLMMCANNSYLNCCKKYPTCAKISMELWHELYDIKYSKLWKEE